jgi:hypothetical protein
VFFTTHLPNVLAAAGDDNRTLGRELWDSLQGRSAIQKVPLAIRLRLIDALNNGDRQAFADRLKAAFPLWREAIATAFRPR